MCRFAPAATRAVTQAFAAVFDCSTPPIERVQLVQDGSLVEGALEQLDTGPYEALASSSYIDVTKVVFENPTLETCRTRSGSTPTPSSISR